MQNLLPAQPFFHNWAKRQQTPTAAFYQADVTRDRPWQIRVEPQAKLLVSSGLASKTAIDKNRGDVERARKARRALRMVAFNWSPSLSEAEDGKKMRNAAKSARRWRRSGK